ncbi:MAG: 50S ribosomal protein L21e [Candidatus Pacearchaeota archaeon]
MLSHKKIRQKGKLGLSRVFAEINIGDKVALVKDLSYRCGFPIRFQGKTGKVIGKQGKSLIVSINDGRKDKKFIVQKIHLKKLLA